MSREIIFKFEEVENAGLLSEQDQQLVQKAREATINAYVPYSNFRVGASVKLKNGQVLSATNQENASYPIGICAERSLLATIGALFPNEPIDTLAVTYHNPNGSSDKPVAPCGMCRQALLEYENRTSTPFRLLMTGYTGKVIVIDKASSLLPLSFSASDMD